MHQVTVNGRQLYAEDGTILSTLLLGADIPLDHPCGGKGSCRKCLVLVNGKEELSCRYAIHGDITVSLPQRAEILSETGVEETGGSATDVCLALDIGTTTLALALVAPREGKTLRVLTRTNPQRAYGADVMSRIEHCRHHGPAVLQRALIHELNGMIKEISDRPVERLYVAGNCTMLHLFLGIDCSPMGVAPYTPAFLASKTASGESLGLCGVSLVECLPSIAAFVGADLVAGLYAVGMPPTGKHRLLIDLGTNAEIVLYSSDSALCTAAAAGPCFEGACISQGMSATSGAIYAYQNGIVKTVGDAPAKGICGTGLIDVIAALVENGTIDETGYMECEQLEIASGVFLTDGDVRQYQLAKAAVYAAILTLMRVKGVSFEEIDGLYISGGFAAKVDIENAVKTGLLPRELQEKCIALRNSSLAGTVQYACRGDSLLPYTQSATYADLSASPIFSDLFMESMMF